MMRSTIQFLGEPRAPRGVAPAAERGPTRKAHIPLEVLVLTRIRDQCIQARYTVDGPTRQPPLYTAYYLLQATGGAPYSNINPTS